MKSKAWRLTREYTSKTTTPSTLYLVFTPYQMRWLLRSFKEPRRCCSLYEF